VRTSRTRKKKGEGVKTSINKAQEHGEDVKTSRNKKDGEGVKISRNKTKEHGEDVKTSRTINNDEKTRE